ncbi:hypothetical protein FOXG_20208 [Fusarium oxysporum f. sp. lycopersici 4287]|uniref:NAD(P)-binding domain-containing protein n=2 Tax=Fusarium oxysporum TaxID=5507 RepID=A0A0J9VDH4_FUSO4|nr:hypothetical protein FOXG_20208 [Fusarium oxysporum f. sp. lycopersici 4287]KNB09454.1 hypothetical protein FOXG_20208 [Fusarium oxysporum f. sp. lycopersici 4287]
MSSVKAIIFGATGAVGRAAVLEAQSRGAQVTLAMRNTKKPIPGFTPELEKKLSFTRVQADLSDPKSVQRAVSESGATVAFSYILFEAEDGRLETHKAMKRAGITHAVLLSSFCVTENGGPKPSSEAAEILNVVHGKAELALAESGLAYTKIGRRSSRDSSRWLIPTHRSIISPPKTSAVSQVQESLQYPSGELIICQCGPELLSQRAAWKVVSEGLGMDISIKEANSDEHREKLRSRGFPERMMKSAVERLAYLGRDPAILYEPETYKAASMNFRKYTGRQLTTFKAWVDKHQEELLAN